MAPWSTGVPVWYSTSNPAQTKPLKPSCLVTSNNQKHTKAPAPCLCHRPLTSVATTTPLHLEYTNNAKHSLKALAHSEISTICQCSAASRRSSPGGALTHSRISRLKQTRRQPGVVISLLVTAARSPTHHPQLGVLVTHRIILSHDKVPTTHPQHTQPDQQPKHPFHANPR